MGVRGDYGVYGTKLRQANDQFGAWPLHRAAGVKRMPEVAVRMRSVRRIHITGAPANRAA
jgi:hypothetical protein